MEQQVSVVAATEDNSVVTLLKIADIQIDPNRRKADMAVVEDLAKSIAEVGLMHPIVVDTGHTLIAGLHRLEAVKALGRDKIKCTVINVEGLRAKLAEMDENFVRRPLTEKQKCEILFQRKQIYEALHPETKRGGDRKSEKIKTAQRRFDFEKPKTFTEDTAEKLGVSKTSVERRVRIAQKLTPEAKEAFDDDQFKLQEALKLTHIDPEHQEEAARQYVSGEIRSIGDYRPGNPGVTDKKSEDKSQEDDNAMSVKLETPKAEESPHNAAVETVSVSSLPQSSTENHDVSVLEPPISNENGVKESERQQSGHTDTDSPEKSDSPASVARDAPKAAKTETPPPKEKPRRAPTIKEIVADLKDADKERPCTPDIFMMEFGRFIEGLIDHIEWFEMPDYTGVFSELTEEQYQTLHEKQKSVRSSMDKFMKLVRRKMKK